MIHAHGGGGGGGWWLVANPVTFLLNFFSFLIELLGKEATLKCLGVGFDE